MQCLSVAELDLSPCIWKCHHILSLMVRRVSALDEHFVIGGHFFLFFFSLLPKKYMFVLFIFCISILVIILFISIFYLGLFFINFLFVFNLIIELQLVMYFFFLSIRSLFFFLGSFVKVLLVFNFTIQSKFMVFFF